MSGSFPVLGHHCEASDEPRGTCSPKFEPQFQATLILSHLGKINQLKRFFVFLFFEGRILNYRQEVINSTCGTLRGSECIIGNSLV